MEKSYLNTLFQLSLERKFNELSQRLLTDNKAKPFAGCQDLIKDMDLSTHTILFVHIATQNNIPEIFRHVDFFLKTFDASQIHFCPSKFYEMVESFIKHLEVNKILIKGIKALEVECNITN